MSSKQNLVFFIGLTLMIMVFWVNGYWSILWHGIAPASGAGSVPPENVTHPKNGKCPPGYAKLGNLCVPPIASHTNIM